jgi:hypothetical protein
MYYLAMLSLAAWRVRHEQALASDPLRHGTAPGQIDSVMQAGLDDGVDSRSRETR